MFRRIIWLCVLLGFGTVKAHQPELSSTILAEQGDNTWVLQIRAALTAFEYEIEQTYGESSYASAEEFQDLLVTYVQGKISIRFNDADIAELQNGQVKLGHETQVVFQVQGTPEALHSLAVSNRCFGDIARNQGALIVVKEGFSKKQFVLNAKNEHTVKLEVDNSRFTFIREGQNKAQNYFLVFAIAIVMISLIWFVSKKRQTLKFPLSSVAV